MKDEYIDVKSSERQQARELALFHIHQEGRREKWTEELLSDFLFSYEHKWVLTRREMLILEDMVFHMGNGLSAKSSRQIIAVSLGIEYKPLISVCCDIKRKLRLGMETQVQQSIDFKRPKRFFKHSKRRSYHGA